MIAQTAEVVFNTAMTGYQEALTDPSYWGQILVMTSPLIGNTGVNLEDVESAKVQAAGFVVRELSRVVSNFRATTDLSGYLAKNNVLGMTGVDTRAADAPAARPWRDARGDHGYSSVPELSDEQLVAAAKHAPGYGRGESCSAGWVHEPASMERRRWGVVVGACESRAEAAVPTKPKRVLALDCGAKRNILRNLADRGCDVQVVPHDISGAQIKQKFATRRGGWAVHLERARAIRRRWRRRFASLREVLSGPDVIPTFGICLRAPVALARAWGEDVQAQVRASRPESAGAQPADGPCGDHEPESRLRGRSRVAQGGRGRGRVTHINLNDQTVAGFCATDRPIFAVQHHPEASPGPHDAGYLFDAFVRMMNDRKPLFVNKLSDEPSNSKPVLAGLAVLPMPEPVYCEISRAGFGNLGKLVR